MTVESQQLLTIFAIARSFLELESSTMKTNLFSLEKNFALPLHAKTNIYSRTSGAWLELTTPSWDLDDAAASHANAETQI